jgi:hypothetical protein
MPSVEKKLLVTLAAVIASGVPTPVSPLSSVENAASDAKDLLSAFQSR